MVRGLSHIRLRIDSLTTSALLKDGYLAKLCADIDTQSDFVLRTLMLVLSHIFGRRICKETDDEAMAEIIRRSPSIVYLPPLPEDAAAALRVHNANTLDIFATYVKTFAAQHMKGEETELPLSHVSVGLQRSAVRCDKDSMDDTMKSNGHAKSNNAEIANNCATSSEFDFLPTLPRPLARSSFVALSGHGDDFETINDLCTSAHSGIFLESSVIPHIELHPDESRTPLNAYLLDFFMHGSIAPLEVANGINRSDVWFVLNDFSLVLATISTSLAQYLGLAVKGRDGDDVMLDVMGSGDADENERDEEEAAYSAPTTTMAAALPVAAKKGKRVLADDWDADEDAEVANEKQIAENGKILIGTDDEEYKKLSNVYRAFRKLKTEFDGKFREIWA